MCTNYGYEQAGRLNALNLNGANATGMAFGYNAAGQISSRTSSNDGYAWTGAVNADRGYGVNGLNQYTSAGATGFGYDGRGNLVQSGSDSYSYTAENQLADAPGRSGLAYDPLGRLLSRLANSRE